MHLKSQHLYALHAVLSWCGSRPPLVIAQQQLADGLDIIGEEGLKIVDATLGVLTAKQIPKQRRGTSCRNLRKHFFLINHWNSRIVPGTVHCYNDERFFGAVLSIVPHQDVTC